MRVAATLDPIHQHAQLLCVSGLPSPPPARQISRTCRPHRIRLIQVDIGFAILITARCRGKQNISANERLRDVSGGAPRPDRNVLLCVGKSVSPLRLICGDIPQRKRSCSQARSAHVCLQAGRPVARSFTPFELAYKTGDESRCGFALRRRDLC